MAVAADPLPWHTDRPVDATVAVLDLLGELAAPAPAAHRARLARLAACEVLDRCENAVLQEVAASGNPWLLLESRQSFADARRLLGLNGDLRLALASVAARLGSVARR